MMNRDGIRIEKIKSNHIELIEKVRDNILENKESVSNSITEVINIIDFDEKSVKKKDATLKAQELITTLTEQILAAKTPEEVFELRKKLNYYINKIKAELKNRNIDEKYLNDYQEKITYLRKDIAKYIRFLKREDNIVEIDKLYSNYENLNKEEMVTLKKALTREINYNRRNLKEPQEKKIVKETKKVPLTNIFEEVIYDSEQQEETPRRPGNQIPTDNKENVEFSDVEEYLTNAVEKYKSKYNIKSTHDYSKKGLRKNISHFFKNIPNYIHNKKAIKHMQRDFCRYYSGSDLGSYIEYLIQRNSISKGLQCILSKSQLYRNYNLVEEDKCAVWLYEFCQKHGISIPYQKVKRI
ncbi:MAG: hypothetical protein IK137_04515 [Bacilli bacterium]|nr:hypothetical protein [Bacilli bacterium]